MPVSHDFSVAYEYLQSSCSHTFSRVENHDMLETHPYPMLSRDDNSSQYQTRLRFFQRVLMGGWSMAVESSQSFCKLPIFPKKKPSGSQATKLHQKAKRNMILTQELCEKFGHIFGPSKCPCFPVFPISIHWRPSIRSTVASQLLVAKGSTEASHSIAVLTLKP